MSNNNPPVFNPDDLEALSDWFIHKVDNQIRHEHYRHTVQLAERYKAYFTGDNQTDMIISYKPGETSEQKEQRIRLYNSFTPHLCGRIFDTYNAVESADEIINRIDYDGSSQSSITKKIKLTASISDFFKSEDARTYLKNNFKRLVFYDPNAFLLIETDPLKSINRVYPVEVPSQHVFDYHFKNGILEYFIAEFPKTIYIDGRPTPAKKYVLYTPDYAIQLDEGEPGNSIHLKKLNKTFALETFNILAGVTPARRVGWILDPSTDFNTCVSPLFKADKLLKDIINTKSEKDLTQALHGFIQKFAYAETCDYSEKEGAFIEECRSGKMGVSGKVCPSCKGTGKKIHTSVQDIIYIKYPDLSEHRIPLSDFVHYVEIPKHIVEQFNTDLDRLENQVMRAVFNSEAFVRTNVATTATEKLIELSYTYRELAVFADALSAMYIFIVKQAAYYNDIQEGLQVLYQFPSNFNLESLDDLLAEREKAVTAQSPYEVVSAIDYKIVTRMNIDSPVSILKYAAKERHRPFKGKSEQTINFIIAANSPEQIDNVIWVYFDTIFNALETAHGPDVYNLSYTALQALIDDEAKRIIDTRIAKAAPTNILIND